MSSPSDRPRPAHHRAATALAVAAAIGGFLFGFDSSVINGAVSSITEHFRLGGVVTGDFADTLFRAAAFARVAAAGRAQAEEHEVTGSAYDSDLAAARLLTLADQLEYAGRLELDGKLA